LLFVRKKWGKVFNHILITPIIAGGERGVTTAPLIFLLLGILNEHGIVVDHMVIPLLLLLLLGVAAKRVSRMGLLKFPYSCGVGKCGIRWRLLLMQLLLVGDKIGRGTNKRRICLLLLHGFISEESITLLLLLVLHLHSGCVSDRVSRL
jgi:hypothetical protein